MELLLPIRDVISEFFATPGSDLRAGLLEMLPGGKHFPACTNLQQANQLLSSLAPIAGRTSVDAPVAFNFSIASEPDVQEVAKLLSTASLLGDSIVVLLMDAFGGEQTLFALFTSQTPWVKETQIRHEEPHGLTVRADLLFVSETFQAEPQKTINGICETLIAIAPAANADASVATNAEGGPIQVGDFVCWTRHSARQDIIPRTRVAWNIAFSRAVQSKAAVGKLTDYTHQMAPLVGRTEKVFRGFTQRWITGKRISRELSREIRTLEANVNSLVYCEPETQPSSMVTPANTPYEGNTVGELLNSVLANLVSRMIEYQGSLEVKTIAVYAGGLSTKTRKHEQSDMWRTMTDPPTDALTALRRQLYDVSCFLHEMSNRSAPVLNGDSRRQQ